MRALMACVFILCPLVSWGGEADWAWISTVPTASGAKGGAEWWVTKGNADVSIKGNGVEAVLYDDGGTEERISIKGTIVGDIVRATIIYYGTDAEPAMQRGVYRIRKFPGTFASIDRTEAIIFQDGVGFLGLVKFFPRNHTKN